MRMRMWAVAAVVLAGAAAGPGRVAAQPAKTTEPTVEVRVRSVNDLLDRAEYIGGLVGQEEPIKQARDLVKHLSAEGKGIEGIDPKRPFGAYATVTPDVHDSPFVVMVPVADKDRLLAAMKERLNITPEKADGGLMKVFVPLVNEVYLAFANGYVYASPNAKALDAKSLIDPKAFFGKDDGSVASVVARIDRVPDQVKGLLASQLEMGLQQERKKGAAANPAEEKLKEIVFDALAGGAKTLVDDGKEVSLKLFIDAKTDELSIEAALSAKDGSTLAKNIAALAGKTSLPAGIVAAAGSPVGKAGVKLALTPDFRTRFAGLVDQGIAEVVKQAKPNERELAKRVLTTLAPTAKAGELDAAVAFTGPDAKGKYGLIGAVAVKDGAEILKLAKDLSIHIPADAAEVSFDVEKVGKFALHKVTLKKTDATRPAESVVVNASARPSTPW